MDWPCQLWGYLGSLGLHNPGIANWEFHVKNHRCDNFLVKNWSKKICFKHKRKPTDSVWDTEKEYFWIQSFQIVCKVTASSVRVPIEGLNIIQSPSRCFYCCLDQQHNIIKELGIQRILHVLRNDVQILCNMYRHRTRKRKWFTEHAKGETLLPQRF